MQCFPKITRLHTCPIALCACFFALICLTSVSHASSPPADSVHVCLPFDYEQWRRDHPRPAAKRLANLNVGEPRTVRMIYFLPNDRAFRQEVVNSMKVTIRQIQTFYADQMAAHGYGRKTFRFETDAQGEPIVHRVDGQHADSHYLDDTFVSVLREIESVFDVRQNIYFVVIDNEVDRIVERATGRSGAGRAFRATKNGGYALVPGGFSFNTAAHELGHTFGLAHDFRKRVYIMSYGGADNPRLSPCHAEFLTVHSYFDPAVSVEAGDAPSIELLSSPEYPAGSTRVAVRLRLRDPEELHQVFLRSEERGGGFFEVWACRSLTGERDDEVVFEYDGYSPSHADWGRITSLSTKNVHPIKVSAVDLVGNVSDLRFELSAEASPNEPRASTIEIISGDDQQGALGTMLNPLIVEVKDQHGQPLPGETVQFGVIEGGARLSGRYLVQNAMTNENGRAELTLTLGTTPETIVVRVSVPEVPECQPVTFNATAVGVHVVSSPSGEPQKWHLPDGAIARLGNGVMGESDRAVSFSPDGQYVAVASGIGVWLYNVATSSAVALFPTTNAVSSLSFSTDGTRLASGGAGNKIDLWDVATGTKSAELIGHTYDVTTVSFSRDGTRLAAGSKTQIVKLWDVESRREIYTYRIERGSSLLKPLPVAFSPDDAILAAGYADSMVRLFDVATGDIIATLPGHRLGVRSVSFSPDGRTLASGSNDGTIKLWDVARRETIATLIGHTSRVTSVSFSRDGRTLASGSNDGDPKLWDVVTGTSVATLSGGHTSWVTSVAFSPDGTTLASGSSQDGAIILWDVATRNATALPGLHMDVGNSVAFSPDGKILASSSEDGTPKLWDAQTGRHIRSFGVRPWGIQVVAVSPDGTTLAAGSLDNSIDLWNIATGDKIASFTRSKGQVLSLAFSPDGTKLATGDFYGISLWDVASVSAASAALGGDVVYGDMATAHYISTPDIGLMQSLSFARDGRTLASAQAAAGAVVNLWDASTLSHLTTLEEGHQVAFSPDGTTLAYGDGQQLKLWDVVARQHIATLPRRGRGFIFSISFSPDGAVLSIGTGSVELWDMASREHIATLEGHAGAVSSLSFSPDGMTLASGSGDSRGDGTVLLWNISPHITPQTPDPDFDGDGMVNIVDFVLFANQFGLRRGDVGYDARYDLDGDGDIGIGDFVLFAAAFGQEGA